MATLRLAAWTTSLQLSDLPASVTQAAVRSFYNWTGCALGGSHHPTTTTALTALAPFFGKPTSTILGHAHTGAVDSGKADASHAALINGIASHVHDYDDTHLETIIHPTGPVASALLAQAEALGKPVGGDEFVLALVAGIEAECKVGLAVWPKHYDIGWHITSTTGSIGAAVAVGKLLNLTTEQMAHAIGIAATQVTGLREMFGSDTKSFHVGRSAQNGLMAAVLASKGYTSSTQALEAKRGWVNVVSASNQLDDVMATLGTVWETAKNSFKPFPCGIVVHPIIDACIQLHRDMAQRGLAATQITSVKCRVHPLVLELTGKKTPQDGLQAKFSVYHGGAVGLVLGKAGPAQYEDKVVTSTEIVSVRDRIDATADAGLGADEAEIVVELDNGTTLTKHVKHAIGSLEVPMTEAQLQDKFIDQVTPVLGAEGAKKASDAALALKGVADVSALAKAL
ncbi:uncharacterized protein Z520_06520 [Fonsecaea multimorphosa CBS 102226]|uniref:MmgE/PrpD family protein n=1 Tax=Fonsecaea multimorphosa CBS 102226 TaxID=1442371 RepID=A0A0D2JW61_9EURO|nr:uncharacterized protein Z520_06520 [Fonsecaea multimorphosa CBS 102226]KIX97742.1 hypothetical protein Z520_06520 [Fonsecaea multimorphosa CBS 102226]OAL23905.1 hypothetical protein AYO22_06081 [Fonsecaea multimorphosa]